MRILLAILAALAFSQPTVARDTTGKWAATPQVQRDWFRAQKNPMTGVLCCNEADGEQVDEDIRYGADGIGRYWIFSDKTMGVWLLVPAEAVLTTPNLHGRPVAWFRSTNGVPEVFCYAPGPLF